MQVVDVLIEEFGVPSQDRFGPYLREMRIQCKRTSDGRIHKKTLSQASLAEAAGFDHSYVSRLESRDRMPTREAVLKLAAAMRLDDRDRDGLLAAAGFMPGNIQSLLAGEPALSEALEFLQNRANPIQVRDDLRHMITLLVRQAQRAAMNRR